MVSPISGSLASNESEPLTLSADITGLSAGHYGYCFEVSDPLAQNSPQLVNVNLKIGGALYVSWDYPAIQAAINDAESLDTVIVAPGTYYENINFNGKSIVLTSVDPNDPNIVAATILEGSGHRSVVTFYGNETSVCELRGFTITGGDAVRGGGIYGGNTHASISNCTIMGNSAYYYGGGLLHCDGRITNCIIIGNRSFHDGGGLDGCDGTIMNCIIIGNRASGYGGGLVWCDGGAITNCIIWSNVGWGFYEQISFSSTPTYTCIEDWIGGGTGNIASNPLFTDTSSADLVDWDLHLLPNSPCIDTGTNTPLSGLPATDIEGNPRIVDGDSNGSEIVDMGVYEYVP